MLKNNLLIHEHEFVKKRIKHIQSKLCWDGGPQCGPTCGIEVYNHIVRKVRKRQDKQTRTVEGIKFIPGIIRGIHVEKPPVPP